MSRKLVYADFKNFVLNYLTNVKKIQRSIYGIFVISQRRTLFTKVRRNLLAIDLVWHSQRDLTPESMSPHVPKVHDWILGLRRSSIIFQFRIPIYLRNKKGKKYLNDDLLKVYLKLRSCLDNSFIEAANLGLTTNLIASLNSDISSSRCFFIRKDQEMLFL